MVALPEDRVKSAEELARETAEAEIAKRPAVTHEDGAEEVEARKPEVEAGAEGEEKPGAPPYAEDPRLSMADRFTKERAKKREEDAKKEPVATTPGNRKVAAEGEEEGKDEGDGGLDVEAKEQPEKPSSEVKPAPAEDPIIEQTINGQKVSMPLSEWLSTARQNLAASDNLAQSKEILKAAKNLAKAHPEAESHGNEDETKAKPGTERGKPPTADRAKLVSAVEAIQTGSPEEGAEVLAELLTAGPSPDEMRAIAEATVEQREAATEANRALTELAREYPDLAKDNELSTIVIQRTVSGMVDALEKAGADPEHIAQIKGRPDWVRDYYHEARKHPQLRQTLRSPADIARDAAKAVNDKYVVPFKQPQPKPEPGRAGRIEVSPEREARKADLPRQPRSASLRSAPGGKAEQSVTDKRRAAFAEVAARR